MSLTLVSWNINSLRLRLDLLPRLIAALDPDLLALQETKVPDALFPRLELEAVGFKAIAHRGMKGYNGVAILSRRPFQVREGFPAFGGREDCRHLAVELPTRLGPLLVHNFYVPAGGDIPDPEANPKFAHKLAFLAEVSAYFAAHPPPPRTVVMGDLNIAPLPNDVWSHRQLLDVVSHTPVETEALEAWRRTGFVDAVRHFVPPEVKHFTWWSYRNRDWKASDRGRRLDHIWVTPDLVPHLRGQVTLKEARDWERGSDHVPVAVTLDL